ncbi:hypothetical protein ACFSB1_11220 [Halopseudomonas phragmitis]|uniref:Uncharacterized protein n=1 Tax=Halopseudomonas phragmitis TaxID=1931241 RepID=A0A1V0B9N4_9GAMM|nr:hypothetical protein [Halopseudomonas phragmitis]AQZ96649.1 hypothetical protein BVH74_18660 [Halopseudomonas phragmitis]
MIKLTATSRALLSAWIELTQASVTCYLQTAAGMRTPAQLRVEHQPGRVQLTLRAAGTVNSIRLPTGQAKHTLATSAQRWIEDCANGRLESAA